MKRIAVFDFFCGCGGTSEGFREAGMDIVWALDVNPSAARAVDMLSLILPKHWTEDFCSATVHASHISPWAEDERNRLNPENGLCLSAIYDAAFDRHLIPFDEHYRLIVSKAIKDHYTAAAAKSYFLNREGRTMSIPARFLPSQSLLETHLELLAEMGVLLVNGGNVQWNLENASEFPKFLVCTISANLIYFYRCVLNILVAGPGGENRHWGWGQKQNREARLLFVSEIRMIGDKNRTERCASCS